LSDSNEVKRMDSLPGLLAMPDDISSVDLSDYLLTRTLLKRISMKITNQPSARYDSEKKLWEDIFNSTISDSQNIVLEKFNVMEWIPRSPGLYHTEHAMVDRRRAIHHITNEFGKDIVFEPYGKDQMIRGGVGCLRILPKDLGDTTLRFLCATNSGKAHRGFIIAMKEDIFSKVIESVQEKGAFTAKLKGEIRFLFEKRNDIPMYWNEKIPRVYLLIDDVSDIGKPEPDNSLDVTAAVTFENDDFRYPLFTYSHFDPTKEGDIDRCVKWIEERYVREYQNGIVLTDFDEKQSHFSNTVFPVKSLMNPNLTKGDLTKIFSELKIQDKETLSKIGSIVVDKT